MDNKPKFGDYVRVNGLTEKNVSLVGTFAGIHKADAYLIDFKMDDSSEYSTVLTIIEVDKCEFISEAEFFLWRLKGRGVGIHE